jgi:uncharacterized protein (DUF2147 family)
MMSLGPIAAALLLLLAPLGASAAAAGPEGEWQDKDGGVIRIARCGARLCGSIVGLHEFGTGGAPPVDVRHRPLCGLVIMDDLVEIEPGLWRGHIVDPSTGRRWGADLSLDAEDHLQLQGYLDVPVLDWLKPTRLWTRFTGRLTLDCHEEP